MFKSLWLAGIAVCLFSFAVCGIAFGGEVYVGSEQCSECHEDQFNSFKKYSKKAHSWDSVKKMISDLKPSEIKECYKCHTTGYQKGGFESIESTPNLAEVGCETCHGPGKEHVESGGDTDLITLRPTVASCETCHNSERVNDFNYKPLLFSGAH